MRWAFRTFMRYLSGYWKVMRFSWTLHDKRNIKKKNHKNLSKKTNLFWKIYFSIKYLNKKSVKKNFNRNS